MKLKKCLICGNGVNKRYKYCSERCAIISKNKREKEKRDTSENKIRMRDYLKNWRKNNKDYHKKWKLKNSNYFSEWKKKNKKYFKDYFKKRREIDKGFIVLCRLRTRLHRAIEEYIKREKMTKSKKYGINYCLIIEHLKPFPKDLSKYHIDHIRPLCSFNFINEDGSTNLEEVQKAFAPENHQWLTIEQNLTKSKRFEET